VKAGKPNEQLPGACRSIEDDRLAHSQVQWRQEGLIWRACAFNRDVPAARGRRGVIFGGPANRWTQAEAQQPPRSAKIPQQLALKLAHGWSFGE
jgi:hypothetical protein